MDKSVDKKLDRVEIESFGFSPMLDIDGKHIGENQYKAIEMVNNFNSLKWLSQHDDKICLHFVDAYKVSPNRNCYVAFIINSKEEFGKLLEQIGYSYNSNSNSNSNSNGEQE